MNRERAKELLPVIKAFTEGKDIQCRSTDDTQWLDTTIPTFSASIEYRIKPEPREYWIPIWKDSTAQNHNAWETAYCSKGNLLSTCAPDELERAALFREVIE